MYELLLFVFITFFECYYLIVCCYCTYQAERDQDMSVKMKELLAEEADIMKHRKGWVVGANCYSKEQK